MVVNRLLNRLLSLLNRLRQMVKVKNAAAAAKSLQLCPTLCDPIDSSPQGSPIPGILQARTLERVAISFSNAWKWKVKVKSSVVSDSWRPHGLQPTRLLHPWDFLGKSTRVACHNGQLICMSVFLLIEITNLDFSLQYSLCMYGVSSLRWSIINHY